MTIRIVRRKKVAQPLTMDDVRTWTEDQINKRWPEVEQMLAQTAQAQAQGFVETDDLETLLTVEQIRSMDPDQLARYESLVQKSLLAAHMEQQAQQRKEQRNA